ncbi:hypothetical protein [Chryseobacterium oncorhynchi]|nr:hypothetical protein [Chryseobacterium oncorhynchi]
MNTTDLIIKHLNALISKYQLEIDLLTEMKKKPTNELHQAEIDINITYLEEEIKECYLTLKRITIEVSEEKNTSHSASETLDLNNLSYSYKEFNIFFEGLDGFLKSMRPKGYFGMSPQNQSDLEEQYIMIEKLREIKDFVDCNYQKNKELVSS